MFKPKQQYPTWKPDQRQPSWQRAQSPMHRRLRRGPVLRTLVLLVVVGLVWYRFGSFSTQANALYTEHSHSRRKAGLQTRNHRSGILRKDDSQHVVSKAQEIPNTFREGHQNPIQSIVEDKPDPIVEDEVSAPSKDKSDELLHWFTTAPTKHDDDNKETASTPEAPVEFARFPPYEDLSVLMDSAEELPDIIHHSFEDSTADVVLEGWEESWLATGEFDVEKFGQFKEPKIDFIYTWVNGSDPAFRDTILPYELNSTLNDAEGKWLEQHRVNRYRDWDELRYSIRTVEQQASKFRNKYMILVNSVSDSPDAKNATVDNPATITRKQKPDWLKNDETTDEAVQILSQEDFFDDNEQGCLPAFNSLTIENQLYNTKSDTDRFFALSDDMLLGKEHAASDIWSTLFGPVMGFKSNAYNQMHAPMDTDARRFGEKPYLIYTSYLLNRRFGERKRKGQHHFGHSLGRSVFKEVMTSFPKPRLLSACQRFRGEHGFQLYSWYSVFHYTIERHREALLWSYIMVRADKNGDGNLDWEERQAVMDDIQRGIANEGNATFRKRQYYAYSDTLEKAGLEAPKVNLDIKWTSHDGPEHIKDAECFEFDVNDCLAFGFSTNSTDLYSKNPIFSTGSIFAFAARQFPKCGDCLVKLVLHQVEKGVEPILPHADTNPKERDIVIKALWKYQYSITEDEGFFSMVTDAEQVENVLYKRMMKKKDKVGQLCLNDDIPTEDPDEIAALQRVYTMLLGDFAPIPSPYEAWESPALVALQTEREAKKAAHKRKEARPSHHEKKDEKKDEKVAEKKDEKVAEQQKEKA